MKNNLGDDRSGYAYRIGTAANGAPVIQWEPDLVTVTLEEMGDAVTERKPRPHEAARTWLLQFLSDGEQLQKDIAEAARVAGHAWRTIERTKKDLGIQSKRTRFDGQWTWKLPETGQDLRYLSKVAADEDRHESTVTKVAAFDTGGGVGGTNTATNNQDRHYINKEELADFDNGDEIRLSCNHCGGEGCDWCRGSGRA